MNRPRAPHESSFDEPLPNYARQDGGGAWIGWAAYAVMALVALCFGAWAGNFRDKGPDVAKHAKAETKPEVKLLPEKPAPEKKPEPEKKLDPMPEPKKEPMPEPKKEVEPKVEPKKEPTPEPKKKDPEPSPEPPKNVTAVSFDKEIQPIFKSKCMICHGDTKGVKGGLDLRTLASIKKGGESGDALVAGNLMKSLIWGTIEDGAMPPADKPQLTDAEKTKIKNWILSGGK